MAPTESFLAVIQILLIVVAPTGNVVPAKIIQQHGGDYQLEYSSKFTGEIYVLLYVCCYLFACLYRSVDAIFSSLLLVYCIC